jgi:hypothetical protein
MFSQALNSTFLKSERTNHIQLDHLKMKNLHISTLTFKELRIISKPHSMKFIIKKERLCKIWSTQKPLYVMHTMLYLTPLHSELKPIKKHNMRMIEVHLIMQLVIFIVSLNRILLMIKLTSAKSTKTNI